jgi:hypothetical protein
MQSEMTHIRQGIEQCKSRGEMMGAPNFGGQDVTVKETQLNPLGLFRYRRNYRISFNNGDWILIEYCSKRSNLLALKSPHRSEVKVTCSDPSLNFTDSWDEKA